MNIAPLQMVELTFRKLSVEVDLENLPDPEERRDAHALLESVGLKTRVRFWRLEQADVRGTPYFVTLRLQVDNHAEDEEPIQRLSPYLIDVEAGAVIVLAPGMATRPDAEDLVAVNGPALLWGAIREQVAGLTARMAAGTALLPSVNFHDLKKSAREGMGAVADTPDTKPAAKRVRKPKS